MPTDTRRATIVAEMPTLSTAPTVGVLRKLSINDAALIPPFGVLGAAWARFAGDVVQVGLLLSVRGLPIGRRSMMGWMLLPLALGALAYFASLVVADNVWVRAPLSLVLFVATLTLTRCARISELRELLGRAQRDGG